MSEKPQHIVFFDGYCGLCSRFVDFLIRKDKKRKLKFASLQGKTAQAVLTIAQRDKFDSVIFYAEGKVYYKSTAALRIFQKLGGFWRASVIFTVIPTSIRNQVYDFIAKNRYQWFGKKETCRLPLPEEKAFFLE